jgi:hypothetical protein
MPAESAPLPQDPGTPISIEVLPSACFTCIDAREVAVLGDTAGPGFLEASDAVLRDSIGRFWVGQGAFLKLYDSAGGYIAQVGRSGEGPMEFVHALPVKADESGRVFVVDAANNRETVIGSELELERERTLNGIGFFNDIAELPDDKYVVNAWAMTPEQIQVPLHTLDGSAAVHSFGSSDATGPLDAMKSLRLLAAKGDRILTAKRFNYELELWDSTGTLLASLHGPRLNTNEVKQGFYNRTDNPIPNQIMALALVEADQMWVVTRKVRDDWQSYYRDYTYPDGSMGLRLKDNASPNDVYTTRIEVIDLRANGIIAVLDRPEIFTAFAGDGLLVEQRSLDDGTPQLAIWMVDLGETSR